MIFGVETRADFDWGAALKLADSLVYKSTGCHLKDIEITVLEGAWADLSYWQMAKNYGYSPEYLNKDVGNKLWRKLSEALGEKVSKRNFKEALKRASKQHQPQISSLLLIPADSIYRTYAKICLKRLSIRKRPGMKTAATEPLET